MPRRKNLACIRCPTQSVETAQAKACWNGQKCHAKRSYYAKHALNKAKKRSRHRGQRLEAIDIPLFAHTLPPQVLITFYRDRADGPIHAIEFAVVDQGQSLSQVKPIHLKGVPQAKRRSHIHNVLSVLKAQFAQDLTVSQARQPISSCPLCKQQKHEHDTLP